MDLLFSICRYRLIALMAMPCAGPGLFKFQISNCNPSAQGKSSFPFLPPYHPSPLEPMVWDFPKPMNIPIEESRARLPMVAKYLQRSVKASQGLAYSQRPVSQLEYRSDAQHIRHHQNTKHPQNPEPSCSALLRNRFKILCFHTPSLSHPDGVRNTPFCNFETLPPSAICYFLFAIFYFEAQRASASGFRIANLFRISSFPLCLRASVVQSPSVSRITHHASRIFHFLPFPQLSTINHELIP
jgi:hypothetical protein